MKTFSKLSSINSSELFEISKKLFPGGVNSPARDFSFVNRDPLFIERAKGSYIYDVDGNKYIDYIGSWGACIVGHSNDQVIDFLFQALEDGLSFGAPCKAQIDLANLIKSYYPSIEMMRFVSSGTEACMSAIRLARSYTKRDLILKFDGHYHGHSDSLLVKSGSGMATLGTPSSSGVPDELAAKTIVGNFNDLVMLGEIFCKYGTNLSAVIIELVCGNCNMIKPSTEFLALLKELCTKYNVLLIADEVMTGFRVSLGGAQKIYQLDPDITILGKVIGGGLPCALYGSKSHIMQQVAPLGSMYQAGTLSANPIAMACGYKTLEILTSKGVFANIENLTKRLADGLKSLSLKFDIPLKTNYLGAMFGFAFTEQELLRVDQIHASDKKLFVEYFNQMLELGVYFAPSAYEACFVSSAHSPKDIDETLEKSEIVLKTIKNKF